MPPSLAVLAEQAWEHVQRRTSGSADIRVVNPTLPNGREISVLEILNDNMPFLYDSTMAELAEQGIEVTLVAHPIIAVERDAEGKLLRFYGEALPEGARGERESLIHLHIARLDADADRQKLIDGLTRTLNDVRACVTDWRAMRDRVEEAIKTFTSNPPPLPIDEVAEAGQFLQWLCADNFTFLGVREYRFSPDSDASDDITTGEGLGILRDPDVKVLRRGNEMVVMTSEIREFMHEPTLLIVIKANVSASFIGASGWIMWGSSSMHPTAGSRANCASSACLPPAPIPARCGRSLMSATRWRGCCSAPASIRTAIRARRSCIFSKIIRVTSCSRSTSTRSTISSWRS